MTSLEFTTSATRQLLAVGDDAGTVHVMEVPRNLRRAAANEKAFAVNFFEREEKRVEFVERRAAELAEAPGREAPAEATGAPAEPKEGEATAEEKLEAIFRATEEKFLEEMGLNVEEAAPAEE